MCVWVCVHVVRHRLLDDQVFCGHFHCVCIVYTGVLKCVSALIDNFTEQQQHIMNII